MLKALRSERYPSKSLLESTAFALVLNGGLETSCFQPFSAADTVKKASEPALELWSARCA